MPHEGDRRWLKRFGQRVEPAEIRLLCFHHAGGSAGLYRSWANLLPPSIEPIAIQLPGRTERFHEPAYDRMEPLVDAIVAAVGPLLTRPYACYGVSMGARVAWALVHALRGRSMPLPSVLFLACDPAPMFDTGRSDHSHFFEFRSSRPAQPKSAAAARCGCVGMNARWWIGRVAA